MSNMNIGASPAGPPHHPLCYDDTHLQEGQVPPLAATSISQSVSSNDVGKIDTANLSNIGKVQHKILEKSFNAIKIVARLAINSVVGFIEGSKLLAELVLLITVSISAVTGKLVSIATSLVAGTIEGVIISPLIIYNILYRDKNVFEDVYLTATRYIGAAVAAPFTALAASLFHLVEKPDEIESTPLRQQLKPWLESDLDRSEFAGEISGRIATIPLIILGAFFVLPYKYFRPDKTT